MNDGPIKTRRRKQTGKQKALWYLKTFLQTFNPITQARNTWEISQFLR
jgi:hypothetical protein